MCHMTKVASGETLPTCRMNTIIFLEDMARSLHNAIVPIGP
jgi:hypothetical protein